ncbi:MAG: Gfo/Idh/MocA family oxidoreductase [Myxococcales bacterium]|nr:Gfo/Idh/MocA family oxidoreductase [Myxococcales bacterium]
MQVALYGLGRMGAHHLRHLGELGHQVLVVDAARGHHGDPRGVDAVVVATPTESHVAVATPWLERGVPVLVEKPLAGSLAAGRALAGFAHCSVGHVERFNPAFLALGAVDARFVQAERLAPWADRGLDVDVVLDLMIHDLDLFWSLTRSPVREVRADGLAVRSGLFDIVHARVETEAGHVGVFTASRISRRPSRTFRVFSPGGYASLDLRAHVGVRLDDRLVEFSMDVRPTDALRSELIAFLDAAAGGSPFPVPAADALPALAMADAIRAACLR